MAQPESEEQPPQPLWPSPSEAGDPSVGDQTAPEPATEVIAPRWTGSAPVPASSDRKRRRRFLDTESAPAPAPVREPTLELPLAERAALEGLPPTDPWAEADPLMAGGAAYTPANAVTLPGPAPTPAVPPVAPPAPPPVGPPDGPRRSRRGRTPEESFPYGPPPGWRPPPGYVVVPVRRRRRWPWILLTLTLLGVFCCCGIPLYVGQPMWNQYPASAALPAQIADLRLREDAESRQAAQALERQMREAHLLAESTFAGIYATPAGKQVTVFGVTGFRWSPESAVNDEIARLTPEYGLTAPQAFETGVRGEYLTCATGRADGAGIVACTWADHGSLGTALFTRLSVEDSVRLLTELRSAIIRRG